MHIHQMFKYFSHAIFVVAIIMAVPALSAERKLVRSQGMEDLSEYRKKHKAPVVQLTGDPEIDARILELNKREKPTSPKSPPSAVSINSSDEADEEESKMVANFQTRLTPKQFRAKYPQLKITISGAPTPQPASIFDGPLPEDLFLLHSKKSQKKSQKKSRK